MNTIGYFEIQSSTPHRDIKFYEAVFKWKFIKEEFIPIEYYRIETERKASAAGCCNALHQHHQPVAAQTHLSVQYRQKILMKQVIAFFNMAGRWLYPNSLFPANAGKVILLIWIITHSAFLKRTKRQHDETTAKCYETHFIISFDA